MTPETTFADLPNGTIFSFKQPFPLMNLYIKRSDTRFDGFDSGEIFAVKDEWQSHVVVIRVNPPQNP